MHAFTDPTAARIVNFLREIGSRTGLPPYPHMLRF